MLMVWVEGKKSVHDGFGDDGSIEAWHKNRGLFVE